MKRTISAMVGKGSVNHNSRKFHAANTDPARSHLNKEYINEDIRTVYHELFDKAVERYNAKQTRQDRCIADYYEKIRSGKQEKPFHELILQIGNKDDCGAATPDGEKAAQILDEYMRGFQERNPTLRVFSAHLHMDEATPHLHIDFVPYTIGSRRGLDTRVSLKQALAALGFKGGTRGMTEWNQWVGAEKHHIAEIMQEHGLEWVQKGTHEEHLSVLDFKKQERAREVEELSQQTKRLEDRNHALEDANDYLAAQLSQTSQEVEAQHAERDKALKAAEEAKQQAEQYKARLKKLAPDVKDLEGWAEKYTQEPEKVLPKADLLESASAYREKKAKSVVKKMGIVMRSLYAKLKDLTRKYECLSDMYDRVVYELEDLRDRFRQLCQENDQLRGAERDLHRVRGVLGNKAVDQAIESAQFQERLVVQQKKQTRSRNNPSL